MKRFFINILSVAMMAVALTACHKDNLDYLDNPTNNDEQQEADGSLVSVRMGVKIPDPIEVTTRAVDPDGNGIQNMTLFCFDGEGLLISTATATLEPDPNDKYNETGGILDADIPNTTRVIHLLANQNMAQFKEDEFRNLSEDQVIANLEGSSGMMIYWARVEIPANVVGSDGILQWITVMTNPNNITYGGYHGENNPIIMLRNQAKVMVDASPTEEAGANKVWEWEGTHFVVDGFTVVNTQAFGTVAPYHTVYGYPTYACKKSEGSTNNQLSADWEFTPAFGLTSGTTTNWRDTDYINTPRRSDKFSNISDIDTAPQTYVFETENSSADPVSVIIKGHNVVNGVAEATKYYRVTLTDSEGEQVLVRRNHCYTINIAGNLLYGVNTFAEALDTPATNNVWLSISDEIKSVQNSDFRLSVEKTSVVLDENQVATLNPKSLTLNFSVEKLGSQAINQNDLQISWVDGNQDVSNISTFVVNSNVTFPTGNNITIANGTITLSLLDFNGEANKDKSMLEGTILVKYGHLQRKIKVIIVRQQKFIPTWVTSQVYTSTGSTSSNATMVFTIPQDCPAELFPMKVLISTNELDVRWETGQVLPIIRKGEEGYGEVRDGDVGYKYVYEVTGPGEQFIYMKSILSQTSGASTPITIEAEHFESVTKQVVYADHQRAITVTNVTSSETSTGKPEDKIYYVYLPQKKNAPWAINLEMMNTATNQPQSVNQNDEFLLYSQNLDAYADSEFSTVKALLPEDNWLKEETSTYFPCQFITYSRKTWSSGGRVHAFMPRYTYYDTYKFATSDGGGTMRSHFSVYMKTNKAKSAEIIRISSNQLDAKAAFQATINTRPTTQQETDTGTTIYSPNENEDWTYSNKGTVSTYRSMIFELRNYPAFRFAAQVDGQPAITQGTVDLTDNEESATPVQIEYVPGTEVAVAFDVTSFIAADNTSVDPFGTAFDIFIQTPGLELADGQDNIEKVNDTGLYKYTVDANRTTEANNWSGNNALQSNLDGERKEIRFKTKDIVTEGDIVIYTNPEEISYKTKTFNVTNAPIAGTIKYGENTANVPKDTFVSFSRELDGSRIGSMVVTSDGNYQLRLRKEYEFTWAQNDPVKLHARINNGTESKYYVATFANLEALYNAPNIILVEETEGN